MSRTVVAITGASSGIGAAFARKLAPQHDLLLIARREDRLQEMAQEFSSKFRTNTEVIPADLTAESELSAVAQRIGTNERLVLLVNNAGFGTRGRFWEQPFEAHESMHKLHIIATLHLTHAALNNMVARNEGAIINVASVSAWVRSVGSVAYAATKTWMTAFTEGLYLELRGIQSRVQVQALCPGFTYTEFHDLMAMNRKKLASSGFWMPAETVVEASLDGLRRGKLFVIPGWRYRLMTAVFSKLPISLRLAVEAKGSQARLESAPADANKQLKAGE